jgi:hypothetical protein
MRLVISLLIASLAGSSLCACASNSASATFACRAPPSDVAACSVDVDCATVVVGCYCGAQPVNGVAQRYAATAQMCEDAAASSCALGCANEPGVRAQDGKKAEQSGAVAVRCDHAAGTGVCTSFVP